MYTFSLLGVVLDDKIWIVGGEKPPLHLDHREMDKTNLDSLWNSDYLKNLIKHCNSSDTYFSSTEYIKLNQETVKGPDLPFRVARHAMVKVNETKVYIIGGDVNGFETKKTWSVDFSNGFVVEKGPDLNSARSGHSSAMMKIDGKTILVVVGGGAGGYADVELLDLSDPWPHWEIGTLIIDAFF